MVRHALAALLELEPDIEVVAQAATGDEALAVAAMTPSPTLPRGCIYLREQYATTFPARSRSSAHGTGPRPCTLRGRRAGCSHDAAG